MFKTILVATDGAMLSNVAVNAAIEFAKTNGSNVIALSVVEVGAYMPLTSFDGGMDMEIVEKAMEDLAREYVDRVAALAVKAGVQCLPLTAIGWNPNPHEAIIKSATEHGCDIIFMASHGRTGLDRLFLGSVTQKVLAYSDIPVLVFKQTADKLALQQQQQRQQAGNNASPVDALSAGAVT